MGHQGSVCGRFWGQKSTGEVARRHQGDVTAGAMFSGEGRAAVSQQARVQALVGA
jgi:hypothetical protein